MSHPENTEAPRPTLVELLQDQVELLKEELRKAEAHNEHLRASRVETDQDLPPIARTEANLWKSKFFEASAELTKANRGIRRLKDSNDRLRTRVTLLKDTIEFAVAALGNHPDSNTDLAEEITRLRESRRAEIKTNATHVFKALRASQLLEQALRALHEDDFPSLKDEIRAFLHAPTEAPKD